MDNPKEGSQAGKVRAGGSRFAALKVELESEMVNLGDEVELVEERRHVQPREHKLPANVNRRKDKGNGKATMVDDESWYEPNNGRDARGYNGGDNVVVTGTRGMHQGGECVRRGVNGERMHETMITRGRTVGS